MRASSAAIVLLGLWDAPSVVAEMSNDLQMQAAEEGEVDDLISALQAMTEVEADEDVDDDDEEEAEESNASKAAPGISAKHKKLMEAAKKKSVKTEQVVESLKKKQAKFEKQQQAELAVAAQAKKQATAVMKKMPACAKKAVAVDVKKDDLAKNSAKAKALAHVEAAKSGKKEHDLIVAHAKKHAHAASKALIAEEHDALHGKLMKEIIKIADAEATKAAPIAAKKEVVAYHAAIMQKVRNEVAALVTKDATEVARGLAMKEVKDQMGKSAKVRALVSSVAKDAAKYFAHKFSKQQLSTLVAGEAKRQLGERIQHHTELHIGGAEADAKNKLSAAQQTPTTPCAAKAAPKKA